MVGTTVGEAQSRPREGCQAQAAACRLWVVAVNSRWDQVACLSVCPRPGQLLGTGTKEAENWRIRDCGGVRGRRESRGLQQ